MLQKQLEKAEELVSGKAETRNALLKDVSETYIFRKRERERAHYFIIYCIMFYLLDHIFLFVLESSRWWDWWEKVFF